MAILWCSEHLCLKSSSDRNSGEEKTTDHTKVTSPSLQLKVQIWQNLLPCSLGFLKSSSVLANWCFFFYSFHWIQRPPTLYKNVGWVAVSLLSFYIYLFYVLASGCTGLNFTFSHFRLFPLSMSEVLNTLRHHPWVCVEERRQEWKIRVLSYLKFFITAIRNKMQYIRHLTFVFLYLLL